MADLLQTLRAASGVEDAFTTDREGAATPASAAQLKDANDSTRSTAFWSDDIGGGVSGTWGEQWTIDSATTPGSIEFVRVKLRARRDAGGTGSIRSRIAGAQYGSTFTLTATHQDFAADFTTDPTDGNPWTTAKVNAKKWGWFVSASAGSLGLVNVFEPEFAVELWGTLTAPAEEGEGGRLRRRVRSTFPTWRFRGFGFVLSSGPVFEPVGAVGLDRRPLSEFVKFELGHRQGIEFPG